MANKWGQSQFPRDKLNWLIGSDPISYARGDGADLLYNKEESSTLIL